MRLLHLQLCPFGIFDDLTLDFVPGRVHLVYGANEAGKSTCHAALSAHLFGWSRRKDAHGAAGLRGALSRVTLGWQTAEGQTEQATRLASQKVAVDGGREVDGARYQERFLPFTQGEFETLFALDHDALRDGGSLLGDHAGSLRDALFAAARSGEDLGRVRAELRKEEAELYKPKGRTPALNKAISRMRAELTRAADLSSPPDSWDQAARALEAARSTTRELAVRLERCRSALADAALVRKLHDYAATIAQLSRELAALPPPHRHFADPSAPDAAAMHARLRHLQGALQEAARGRAATEARLLVLEDELHSAERDAAFAPHVDAAREASRAALELSGLLERELPDGALTQMELAPPDEPTLHALHEALHACERAEADVQRLIRKERELRASVDQLGEPAAARAVGAAQLRALEREAATHERRLAQLIEREQEHRRAARELTARAELDLETLRSAKLPTLEQARDIVAEWVELDGLLRSAEREAARAAELVEQLEHELALLDRDFPVPSEDDLRAAREARDSLLRTTPPAVEPLSAAILRADGVVDSMRRASTQVAERAAKAAGVARAVLQRGQRDAEVTALRRRVERYAEELRGRGRGVPAFDAPRELIRWAELRERAVALHVEAEDLRHLRAELEAHERELLGVLDVKACRALSTSFAERAERAEQHERALALATAQRLALLQSLDESARAREHAQEALELASARVRAAAAAAGAAKVEREELDGWIRQTRQQRAAWERARAQTEAAAEQKRAIDERRALLRERLPHLGLTELSKGTHPERIAAVLDERIHSAVRAQERAIALRRDVANVRAELAATAQRSQLDEEDTKALLVTLQLDGVEAALQVLACEARRQELERAEHEQRALARRVAMPHDPDPLLARAATTPLPTLDAEQARLSEEAREIEEQLDRARRDEASSRVGYESMLNANHAAADALSVAAAAQAEATSLALRWVTARLGVQLLHRALERYRQEHQDPVLTRASEVFSALTGGRYRRVLPELGDGKERVRLAAERKDGEQVLAQQLSEGTRDQLYLALRIGTLTARADSGRLPLPIVLDDVFVNFDDERTARGLAQLASLLPLTDVVYFTHHERVLELAQEHLAKNSLDVVRLPRRAV